jgi:hypothetical protein
MFSPIVTRSTTRNNKLKRTFGDPISLNAIANEMNFDHSQHQTKKKVRKHKNVRCEATNSPEDAASIPSEYRANDLPTDFHKITLSLEEKCMNGAPEGDIYNAAVLVDNELLDFADKSHENILQSLFESFGALNGESPWIERFSHIELFRRILWHHSQLLSNVDFQLHIELMLSSLDSLRSSEVRNGLAACRLLLCKLYNSLTMAQINAICTALTNRSASGPKFIILEAVEALEAISNALPPLTMIESLLNSIHNKNADVANRSIVMISKKFLLCAIDIINNETILPNVIKALSVGLSSKRSSGRQFSKEALIHLRHETMKEKNFDMMIQEYLSPFKAQEIIRELPVLTCENKLNSGTITTTDENIYIKTQDTMAKPWKKRIDVEKPWTKRANKSNASLEL